MAGSPRDELIDRLSGPPPAGFNAEYAKLQLAVLQAEKRKPWQERLTVLLSVIALLVSGSTAILNLIFYLPDRESRERKLDFENSVTLVRIYFERVASLPMGEPRCRDARLYGRTARLMAGLPGDAVVQDVSAAAGRPGVLSALASTVVVLDQDISNQCSAPTFEIASGEASASGVVAAVRGPGVSESNYVLPQSLGLRGATPPPAQQPATQAVPAAPGPVRSAQPPAAGGEAVFRVYIQYARDDPQQRRRAVELQQRLQAGSAGFTAPGAEGVVNLPARDQIRIYRLADADRAERLKADPALGLAGAQVVNLETAFRNLPANIIEVWLAR
jgi:hypothetical protein